MLVTVISISGYSQNVSMYEIDKKSFTNQNFYQIKDLINFFINDLEKFSIIYHDVNDIDESSFKSFLYKIRNSDIISDFDLNQDGVLGVSKSIYDDTKITVSINPNEWSNSSDEKKLYVLYHELGHDILNLKHGEGGKMMFSLSEEDYSLYDFLDDRDEMFNYFFKDFLIKNVETGKLENIYSTNSFSLYSGYSFRGKNITGKFSWYDDDGLIHSKGYLSNGVRDHNWEIHKISIYEVGDFNMGKRVREWFQYRKSDGVLIYSNFYLGNEKHYVRKGYHSNGKVSSEVEINNNLYVGDYSGYYENGKLRVSGKYNSLGKKTGEWKTFYEDGKVKTSEIHLENGESISVLYDEDGQKFNGELVTYKDDPSDWYNQGKPKVIDEINNYKDGILNGVSINYNFLGDQKSSECFYVNGKLEGKYILYGTKKENGEFVIYKKSESNYTNNKQNGVSIKYYENGYEKERTLWENGKFIKKL